MTGVLKKTVLRSLVAGDKTEVLIKRRADNATCVINPVLWSVSSEG